MSLRAVVGLPEPPLVEGRASGRCHIGMIEGLRSHDVEVVPVAARQWFAIKGAPPEELGVDVVDVPAEEVTLWSRARRLRRPLADLAGTAFDDRLTTSARDADVLALEEVGTACCGRSSKTPRVIHLHNLVRLDRDLGPPWQRSFRATLELHRAELAALRTADALVVSSPVVAEAVRGRVGPGREVVHAPLTLRPADYPAVAPTEQPVAGVIGTGSWPTTAAMMNHLVREIWPKVRAGVPAARLQVAGRATSRLFDPATPDGVEVQGEVPSARAWLQEIALVLFPIARGSGMKVKTMEALLSGVPVVTTSAGAEGVASAPGVLVCDDHEQFVATAVRLLRDADQRAALGAANRAWFLENLSPERATAPLVELYRRMGTG